MPPLAKKSDRNIRSGLTSSYPPQNQRRFSAWPARSRRCSRDCGSGEGHAGAARWKAAAPVELRRDLSVLARRLADEPRLARRYVYISLRIALLAGSQKAIGAASLRPTVGLGDSPSTGYENGFTSVTPRPEKCAVLRVTSVRPCVSAVAAICLSIAFSGCGTRKRPHTWASS